MHILFLTPQPPRPDGGGAAIRNWHLIEAAREAGHTVDVATFCPAEPADLRDYEGVAIWTPPPDDRTAMERITDIVLRRAPDLALRLRSRKLAAGIDHLHRGENYDIIQVEGLEMWPNIPGRRTAQIGRAVRFANGRIAAVSGGRGASPGQQLPPIIYDAHNAESVLQHRTARQAISERNVLGAAYSFVQWLKLRSYERRAIRKAAATLAVSASEAAILERLANRPVDIVPIGVDTGRYRRDGADLAPPIPFDIVFSGTLDYRANEDAAIWLARHVWPRIRAAKPAATLALVGRNPTRRVCALDGKGGITVTGAVPDDRPYLSGATVYALPVRFGAGVRVKFLNALSMGCAIVATDAACEGVDARDGAHFVVAPTEPTAFAAATIALLDDPARRERIGTAGRTLVKNRYEWSIVTPAMLDVYERIGAWHG